MKNRRVDIPRVLNWVLENVIFAICAAVLFFRTAEVMATFAPNTVMGYSSPAAHEAYGYLCALLVEGVLVLAKFSIAGNRDDVAWMYNVVLIGVTFFISASAQLVDVQYVKQQLASQPPMIQALVNYGIPLVPSIVLLMAVGKTVVETIPPSITEGFRREKGKAPYRVLPRSTPAALPAPDDDHDPETVIFPSEAVMARIRKLSPDERAAIARMPNTLIRAKFGGRWKDVQEVKRLAKENKL